MPVEIIVSTRQLPVKDLLNAVCDELDQLGALYGTTDSQAQRTPKRPASANPSTPGFRPATPQRPRDQDNHNCNNQHPDQSCHNGRKRRFAQER